MEREVKNISLRWTASLLPLLLIVLQSCNSPFQPEQVYSPKLVLYGIAFEGDSTLVVRVDVNSKTAVSDTTAAEPITGLGGTLVNAANGAGATLAAGYVNGTNLLSAEIHLVSGMNLTLQVHADGYESCSSNLTVLDSGVIYPAYYTTSVLRNPSGPGQPAPKFTVYPSPQTAAIRLTMALIYNGVGQDGSPVTGEIDLAPSYQLDTTSYFLRINGATTAVQFNLSDYSDAFSNAVGKISSGRVVAVIRLLQVDATLYDFYSISNGFNDPLTMRTEKPVFSNVTDGLGFFGSAAEDSLTIQVFP